ncbi:class I adenylate-forming enzyme family protein [Shewanella waksmanii]|uniref:class I adenylate-forming enzyme family protein n=1 Tax=Shewanella waksmanii TaxID=213783 RepID=UPI0037366F16
MDANAHHIDIQKTALELDDTDILTDTELSKLCGPFNVDSALVLACKKHVMLFTSGSTGRAKCIKLVPGKVMQSALDFCDWFNIDSTSKVLCIAPLSTMTGLRTHLFMPMVSQCQVMLSGVGDIGIFKYLEIVEKQAVTHLIVGPPFIRMLAVIAKRIAPSQITSLRYILCTGASLSQKDVATIQQYLSLKVLNYYGLTETYGFCIAQRADDNNLESGSIGIAINGVDAQLRQPNSDGVGRLIIKSDRLFSGYLGAEGAKVTELDTGDLASKSGSGAIILHGRADEAIKLSSTELVYPHDIESVLKACSYIDDVVVGRHEQGWQATIASGLAKSELLQKLKADLDGKYIPPYFSVSKTLPRTPLGKLPQRLIKD